MNIKDIRNKDMESLQILLEDLREELFNLRNQQVLGHMSDYSQIKKVKRSIAQVLTVMRERELGIGAAEE